MKDSIRLINLYLEFIDKKGEYESVYKRPFSVLEGELQNSFLNISLNELVDLYVEYATNSNQTERSRRVILDSLYKMIIDKLNDISLMKVIDLYADFFNQILDFEENMTIPQNIITAKSMNAKDEYQFERQASKSNLSKEEFLRQYKEELDYYSHRLESLQKSYELLDKLQDAILIFIEVKLEKITEEESSQLFETLNNRIEANEKERLKRKELRKNRKKLEMYARFKNMSMYEILESLDIVSLKNKNYVYDSYRETIIKKQKENTQK